MKNILILLILISPLLLIQCSDTSTNPNTIENLTQVQKKVVESSDLFGVKLFKQINSIEGDSNIFISPLSVTMALGMTLNGAGSTTYEAMQSTLEFKGLSKEDINLAYRGLIDLLSDMDSKVLFQIANSIWYRNSMVFENEFLETNKKYFDAEVEGLDFGDPNSVKIINNWVNDNTNGKIPKILESIPAEAVMYLINAIYFKGTWKYEFDPNDTMTDNFYLVNGEIANCEMMNMSNNFNYYSNTDYQILDLPYGDGSFSMTIILPNTNKSIGDIIHILEPQHWADILQNLTEREGTIAMPKIELSYEIKLNDVLKSLGMEVAFEPFRADFTNLYRPGGCYISKVKHKTYVKINEEGTEAAAATIVQIDRLSAGNTGFYMKMDHPFIFMIREKKSGTILFIGKIMNPLAD